jgi:hypothetical protein
MKGKARCKLCETIVYPPTIHGVESNTCSCGEITIRGAAEEGIISIKTDKSNLVIIDDEGNEIIPKQQIPSSTAETFHHKWDAKDEAKDTLNVLIRRMEQLPSGAMTAPITHSDYYSLLMLLQELT